MQNKNNIFDFLKSLNFKSLNDFTPKQQKLLFHYLPDNLDLVVYAKVIEQSVEFSDNNNSPLWKTNICFASFVIIRDGILFDKFVAPLKVFRVRNFYENDMILDIMENLLTELDLFDEFIASKEEENIYDA